MKRERAKVSVIIPVYNVAEYLEECLEGVTAQSFEDLQILLIDDGSEDDSGRICDAWAAKDPRITVIHQANGGLSAARNTGLAQAEGEWILFADSDDVPEQDVIEKALQAAEAHACDIAVFGYDRIPGNTFFDTGHLERCAGRLTREESLRHLALGNITDHAWNKLCKRELFTDIRYPVREIFEDIAVTCRLFDRAAHVYVMTDVYYHYRRRSGSILDMPSPLAYRQKMIQRDREYRFLQEKEPAAAALLLQSMYLDELQCCIECVQTGMYMDVYREMKARMVTRPHILRDLGIRKKLYQTGMKISDRAFEILVKMMMIKREIAG